MMDNWAHRSERMRCQTCMWYVSKLVPTVSTKGVEKQAVDVPQAEFGRCRRHAPTMSGFPAVYGDDWCGDHKLDEAYA